MDAVERLSRKVASEPTVLASEHRHRYELAARLCTGLRVADVCCGTGYGAEILNETAAAVTGIDVDEGAIEAARADLGGVDGIELQRMDALEFLRQELRDRFEAIVLLEGLEHLQDPEAALRELRRHAGHGIKLVVSVPNSRAFEEENEFHVSDFGYEEMQAAFEDFEDVTVLHQFLAEGSLIRSGEAGDAGEPVGRFDLLEHGEPEFANHFISCVGFGDSAELQKWSARMHLNVAPAHNSYMLGLAKANRELWRTNALLANERLEKAGTAAAASDLQARAAEMELAELKQTASWRLIAVIRRLRRAQRRLTGRSGGPGPQ